LLATVEFQAIGIGTSPITLSNVTLLDPNFAEISFTSSDGSVTIASRVVPELAALLAVLLIATGSVFNRTSHVGNSA
jgi:hypothetical protein